MTNLGHLFQLSFWFNPEPLTLSATSGQIMLVIFVALMVVGAIVRIRVRRHKDRYVKKVGRRLSSFLSHMSVLGLLMTFFMYEGVAYLEMRFWFLLWVLLFVVWGLFLLRYARKTVPEMRAKFEARAAQMKYQR